MSKIKKIDYKSKIIKVDTNIEKNFINKIDNKNFLSSSNVKNLSFVIKLSKILKVKKINLIKAVKDFKGLKYRQQIVFKNNNLTIINDSKSTSYSSCIDILRETKNIYWLVGGIPKKGDKFNLHQKYYRNIKGYIFGKNQKKFFLDLKNKIELKKFTNLRNAWFAIIRDIKSDKSKKKMILFSPAAASFDSFDNFEDRGKYFNQLVKEYKSV